MRRSAFLRTCGLGCWGILGTPLLLESCAGVKYLDGTLKDSFLEIPLNTFEVIKKDKTVFRKYVLVQNEALQYPICVYRISPTEFQALLMKCTHQGTELQAYGDRLQCPAHGSEFNKSGTVQNGPADQSLRKFPVQIYQNLLRINLT